MNLFLLLIIIVIILVIIVIIKYSSSIYNKIVQCTSQDDVTPFINISNRKCLTKIRNNWKVIRDEAMLNKDNFSSIKGDLFFNGIIKDNKWKKIYLKWYSESPNYAYKLFPKTMKLIDSTPEIKLAMFSKLDPGTKILPHYGPFRGCIRVHLGLSTPNSKNCFILVDGKKYYWKNGEMIGFDDTFLHSVENNTNKERLILFLDVERNFKYKLIKKLNEFIIRNIASKTSRINLDLEKDVST